MIRKIGVYLMLFCLLAGLPGCSPAPQEAQYFYAMDTLISLRLEGDDGTAFAACRARVEELEQKFSTTLDSSEIARLNREDGITIIMVSHDIAAAVRYATHILHISHEPLFFGKTADYLATPAGRAFSTIGGEEA